MGKGSALVLGVDHYELNIEENLPAAAVFTCEPRILKLERREAEKRDCIV